MAQHLLIQVSHHCIKTSQQATDRSLITWGSLSAARRNLRRPPGGTSTSLGAKLQMDPLF